MYIVYTYSAFFLYSIQKWNEDIFARKKFVLNTMLNFFSWKKKIVFISQDYICHETISKRTKVLKCPDNDQAAQERSKKKKCDTYRPCNGKTLVYHCARDNNILWEACAPIVTILGSL